MILKLKSFTQVILYVTRNFSQRVFLLTSLIEQDILLRYIAYIPNVKGTILVNTLRGT